MTNQNPTETQRHQSGPMRCHNDQLKPNQKPTTPK
jgi:hypothetical protein